MSRLDMLSCASLSAMPLSDIIALDYYDGPIQGVARCAQGDCAYTFEMVAWDEGQDVRVYRLAALPAESYAQLVNTLTALGEPRQPMWVPVWTFPTQEERRSGRSARYALPWRPPVPQSW